MESKVSVAQQLAYKVCFVVEMTPSFHSSMSHAGTKDMRYHDEICYILILTLRPRSEGELEGRICCRGQTCPRRREKFERDWTCALLHLLSECCGGFKCPTLFPVARVLRAIQTIFLRSWSLAIHWFHSHVAVDFGERSVAGLAAMALEG